jgi:hypothetical protein
MTKTDVADSAQNPQPPPEKDYATIALLRRWRDEDATDDPELIRQAELELEEFKHNMNENRRRAGAPPIYP